MINTCERGNYLSASMLFDVSNDVDGFVYTYYPLNSLHTAEWGPILSKERKVRAKSLDFAALRLSIY